MSTPAVQFTLVAAFAIGAIAIARAAHVPLAGAIARAASRATVQLVVVGGLLTLLTRAPWAAGLFVAVMLTTATVTATGRIGIGGIAAPVAAAIAAPAVIAAVAILLSGAVPGDALSVVATAGILVGGAMTAASLTGRALARELERNVAQIETRLCLGATVREATGDAVRHAVVSGLVPALDQTRTVGLIALPGTFVGLVLGGATPGQAARVQVLVLVALLAVQLTTATLAARTIVRRLTVPGAERLRAIGAASD